MQQINSENCTATPNHTLNTLQPKIMAYHNQKEPTGQNSNTSPPTQSKK